MGKHCTVFVKKKYRKTSLSVTSSVPQQQQQLHPSLVLSGVLEEAPGQELAALRSSPAALDPVSLPANSFCHPVGREGRKGRWRQVWPWGVTATIQSLSQSHDNPGNPVGLPPVPRGDNVAYSTFGPFFSPGVCQKECGYLNVWLCLWAVMRYGIFWTHPTKLFISMRNF